MAHHDAVENNPKKEIATALIGIVLLLVIILGIGVSAYLRPAGEHQPKTDEVATQSVAGTDNAMDGQASTVSQSDTVAPAQAENAGDTNAPVQTATTADSPQSAPANETATTTPSENPSEPSTDTAKEAQADAQSESQSTENQPSENQATDSQATDKK